MKTILLIITVFFLSTLNGYSDQGFKVIVNKKNNAISLTQKDVSDLFLKKKSKWSDGTTVLPVDLNSNSKVREDFSKSIHGKSTSAIRNFWQQAAFSGTASAPPEKSNDEEIIEYVKRNPGAIGYVSLSAITDDVNVINIK